MRRINEMKLRRMVANYRVGLLRSHLAPPHLIDAWVLRYATAMRNMMFQAARRKE